MLTPGAQVGQLVESLIADLQSSGSAGAAAELLDRVHALLEPAGDPAMMAMLVATDQIAARWRCEADQLEVIDALSAGLWIPNRRRGVR
jgi:hypothetical protein